MLCIDCGKSLGNVEKAARCPECAPIFEAKCIQEQLDKENAPKKPTKVKKHSEENESYIFIIKSISIVIAITLTFFFLYMFNPRKSVLESFLLLTFLTLILVYFRYYMELWLIMLSEHVLVACIALVFPFMALKLLFSMDTKPYKEVAIVGVCSTLIFVIRVYYFTLTKQDFWETVDAIQLNLMKLWA